MAKKRYSRRNSSFSLLRNSNNIRMILLKKFERAKVTNRDIVEDAAGCGYHISESALSKYLKHGNIVGGLLESDIAFLCIRWKVSLDLKIDEGLGKEDTPMIQELKQKIVVEERNPGKKELLLKNL